MIPRVRAKARLGTTGVGRARFDWLSEKLLSAYLNQWRQQPSRKWRLAESRQAHYIRISTMAPLPIAIPVEWIN